MRNEINENDAYVEQCWQVLRSIYPCKVAALGGGGGGMKQSTAVWLMNSVASEVKFITVDMENVP